MLRVDSTCSAACAGLPSSCRLRSYHAFAVAGSRPGISMGRGQPEYTRDGGEEELWQGYARITGEPSTSSVPMAWRKACGLPPSPPLRTGRGSRSISRGLAPRMVASFSLQEEDLRDTTSTGFAFVSGGCRCSYGAFGPCQPGASRLWRRVAALPLTPAPALALEENNRQFPGGFLPRR